jgi:hypothetical protein
VPRAGWVKPRDDQRLTDHVALGVLTRTFPPGLVDAAVAEAGKQQLRSRLLPSRLVVYYVLAMALFSSVGYEEVMRHLVEGLSWQAGCRQAWTVPSQPAISRARARLGPGPLERLFDRACVPLAAEGMPGGVLPGPAAGEHGRHGAGPGRYPGRTRRSSAGPAPGAASGEGRSRSCGWWH